MDAFKGGQQNGNLGQTGGIHHFVAIDLGKAGMLRIGDVDKGNGEIAAADGAVKIQSFESFFELLLKCRAFGISQGGIR